MTTTQTMLLVGVIYGACMVGWKLTAGEMHNRASPKYSPWDHIGWWVCTVGGPAVVLFMYFFVFKH